MDTISINYTLIWQHKQYNNYQFTVKSPNSSHVFQPWEYVKRYVTHELGEGNPDNVLFDRNAEIIQKAHNYLLN